MEYIDFLEPLVLLEKNKSADLTIKDKDGNNLLMIALLISNTLSTANLDLKKVYVQKLIDLDYLSIYSSDTNTLSLIKKDNLFLLDIFPNFNVIEHMFDSNYLNFNGENALMIACESCIFYVFECLIQKTNIYHKDKYHKTILHKIIDNKTYDFVKSGMLYLLNEKIQKTILELIKEENKHFLISLIHIYINNNFIDRLIVIIKNIESIIGYSLNIDVKKLIEYYQESIPRPLSKNTFIYPRSGRPVTKMTKLIDRSSLFKLPPVNSIKIFNNFHIDPSSFCLNIDTGIYQDVYIPVLRYGKSASHGYYGTLVGEEYTDANFTWYYIEPDSDIYLHGGNVLVSRNKLQAVLKLNSICYETFPTKCEPFIKYENQKLISKSIKEYLKDIKLELNKIEKQNLYLEFKKKRTKKDNYYICGYKLNMFMENNEIRIMNSRFTNFFRTIEQPGLVSEIYFSEGKLDYLDKIIDELAKRLNIDIVILTHQSGNSGRLVSELLDTRNRLTSFSNLYLSN